MKKRKKQSNSVAFGFIPEKKNEGINCILQRLMSLLFGRWRTADIKGEVRRWPELSWRKLQYVMENISSSLATERSSVPPIKFINFQTSMLYYALNRNVDAANVCEREVHVGGLVLDTATANGMCSIGTYWWWTLSKLFYRWSLSGADKYFSDRNLKSF